MSPEVAAGLRELAAQERTTIFVVLLAALKVSRDSTAVIVKAANMAKTFSAGELFCRFAVPIRR